MIRLSHVNNKLALMAATVVAPEKINKLFENKIYKNSICTVHSTYKH